MSDKTIESIQLFFKVEPSDKVYNATLLETSKGHTLRQQLMSTSNEAFTNHHLSRVSGGNSESCPDELKDVCDPAYLKRMQNGLKHWIDAGKNNALDWGILHFRMAYS